MMIDERAQRQFTGVKVAIMGRRPAQLFPSMLIAAAEKATAHLKSLDDEVPFFVRFAWGAEPGGSAPKQQLSHPSRIFHVMPTEDAQQLDRALSEVLDLKIDYFEYLNKRDGGRSAAELTALQLDSAARAGGYAGPSRDDAGFDSQRDGPAFSEGVSIEFQRRNALGLDRFCDKAGAQTAADRASAMSTEFQRRSALGLGARLDSVRLSTGRCSVCAWPWVCRGAAETVRGVGTVPACA